MKLSIELSDREEVAAAIPLLQLILENTFNTPAISDCASPAKIGEANPPEPDPAAVFGSAPAAPLAPSIPTPAAAATVAPPPPAITATTIPTPGPVSSGAVAGSGDYSPSQVAAAQQATVAGSVELDSKGMPWDDRIHSSGKTKVKDGSWRYKGGIPPERITAVEVELRGNAGSLPPAAPTVPTPPPAAPAGAASPTISALPPAAPAVDPTTFEQLMPRLTAAVTAGTMPAAAINSACAAVGAPSVVALQQNPDFVPLVWATLKQQFPGL